MYKAKKGCEGLTVHTLNGRIELGKATQTELKKLFQMGVAEVEETNEEVPEKKKKK